MKCRKLFFPSLWIIIGLLGLHLPTEGAEDALFSKIGIQPIKDKRNAPNFCLENLNGKKVELKNFKEKVVFLNFWATWCSPCKEEMPSMETLYQKFKGKNFILLTISVDYNERKAVKKFIERHHYTFPVLLDPKCYVLDLYKVKGIPTTFIIDKNRRIIGKAVGPRNWKNPEVFSLLNFLIEK